MSKKPHSSEPIVIKKYANRRLYNTDTSSYVTLNDLCDMVKEGADFIVYDAKSGEDLTRQILTQIIFEEESHGEHLLPVNFLRSLIGFYDNNLKDFIPHYLESSMQSFMKNQEKMREMLGMGTLGSFGQVAQQLEEIGKQNMELFTKAFGMFTPFKPATPRRKSSSRTKPNSPNNKCRHSSFALEAREIASSLRKQKGARKRPSCDDLLRDYFPRPPLRY